MDSHRRLPHVYPAGRWLFVTWHLQGSLPSGRYPPPHKASAGEAFVWIDRQLDLMREGPLFLRDDAVANVIVKALFKGADLAHYQLGPFAIMANHVHVLLMPRIDPSLALKALKGSTAREANRLLERTGEPFWQKESYDHCVRNDGIAAYIENNPVRAPPRAPVTKLAGRSTDQYDVAIRTGFD
jgi:putative transposase